MKKIFVTGGSGYIGSVVVKRLIERGYEVVVFDNLERGHRRNVEELFDLRLGDCLIGQVPKGFKGWFIKGDLRNEEEIERAMMVVKPDAVIHFAAYALVGESMADPMMYFENNVKGGINLLKAMEKSGCTRIIFSSSCATYGVPPSLPIEEDMRQCPTNPYGHSKLMFEQMCRWLDQQSNNLKSNNPTIQQFFRPTFLRYFNAAGAALGMAEDHDPETHIIPNVLKVALGQKECVQIFGDDYPTPDGTCIRDYVHVEDLCSAHILALEKGATGAFNLGTGQGVSVKEIVEACRKVTGHPIPSRCVRGGLAIRRPYMPAARRPAARRRERSLGGIQRIRMSRRLCAMHGKR